MTVAEQIGQFIIDYQNMTSESFYEKYPDYKEHTKRYIKTDYNGKSQNDMVMRYITDNFSY